MLFHSKAMIPVPEQPDAIRLGLRENWEQFALLVLVNAFVGGMVGVERVVLPLLAEQEFGLASKAAVLSFIASFGLAKAIANLLAGRMVVISHGVLNLVPEKEKVFAEILRILRPGGRLQLADIVLDMELSEDIRSNIDLWTG